MTAPHLTDAMTRQERHDALMAQARESRERSAASWERSDTDGYLTQWASNLTAQKLETQAEIELNGGTAEFPALFDLEGNLVPAKYIEGKYGMVWGLLNPETLSGSFVGWFNPSNARKADTRAANNAKKGYSVGRVKAPAVALIDGGSGKGLSGAVNCRVYVRRADGGFSRDVEIVTTLHKGGDNGW